MEVYELCKSTFTGKAPSPASRPVQKLCSLLDSVSPGDIGLEGEAQDDEDRGYGVSGDRGGAGCDASGSGRRVGDKVQKGQVVCIIKAMKLMNEIEKDFRTAILERKKSPNRLVVDEAINDDNSVLQYLPLVVQSSSFLS
ncbi:hypothetical protein Bca52824_049531 [Brassica carinata]|uniref:Biotin carboxyl carrier protein of acetyl-CoA carboxylase n=1 Tax=Brassica carinata TaxID=52824 RepID=A0A8X7RL03_BRACI|nr:hypothetical protein Bca52824_049531 [Brassica carinata]